MKRVIAIVLLCCLVFAFAGCGNMSIGIGNFTFRHVHFSDGTLAGGRCATVEKWYDNETGIEVATVEYGPMYLSEGSYILMASAANCPYCSNN